MKHLLWSVVFLVVAVDLTYKLYCLWAYDASLGKFDQTFLVALFIIGLVINGFTALARLVESLKGVDEE